MTQNLVREDAEHGSLQMTAAVHASSAPAATDPVDAREPLAIVGIGCRFPGGADSAVAFWRLLVDGVDAIVDVPPDRWSLHRFHDPDRERSGATYTRQGGFLKESIDRFDAMFFGILPREAAHIDPQQRLLLEVTWEALEDAGLVADRLAGTDTGVYIGGFTLDSLITQLSPLNRDIISSHSATGASLVMLSNRISYLFDFRGPSMSIDTACSSSLVAVNYACQDLWQGKCSLAIVGGVNIMLRPEYPVVMSKGGFLAPDSRCKVFDERANGYARGEGAGVVVLKPLAAALRAGDPIYALIRGTGVNQDGRTGGITVPNGDAQLALVQRVYRETGFQPDDLSYIEAHGTGTAIGDPTETRTFGAILAERRSTDTPCLIGSVKANIGHLEAGAGIAGLIKTALVLKHRQVPPQIHVVRPNPKIPFEELGLRLPRGLEPLPRNGGPAWASVNSFGYGGTNAHALLLEAPERDPEAAVPDDGRPCLLPLSARSPEALRALAEAYIAWLDAPEADGRPVPMLRELGHAMGVRRSHHNQRLAIVANSPAQLIDQLRTFVAEGRGKGMAVGQVQRDQISRPVFVFTGMGPQWWAMGRELFATEPVFRAAAEAVDAAFRRHSGWSILEEMLADESVSRISSNEIAQPANFVLQVALAALWRSWGVEPSAIVGHSVGEVSAVYLAGALDLDDAARVSFHRSRVQQRAAGLGRMLAAGVAPETAEDLIDSCRDRVSIAAVNSPSSVTLAGDPDALAEIAAELEADGLFNRFLRVEIAYHSPDMEPLKDDLLQSLQDLRPQAPTVPLYSTVSGERIEGAAHDAEYWWRNVRQTVRFGAAIGRLAEHGHSLFVEIGPNPVLAAAIREGLRRQHVQGDVLASLVRGQPERATMLEALGGLYAQGYPLDWTRLFPEGGRHIPLPRYPWQREILWAETRQSEIDRLSANGHLLLGDPVAAPNPAWEAVLLPSALPYLGDHRIKDAVVFPGAGYVEAALAAQRAVNPDKTGTGVIEDLHFHAALVIGEHEKVILRIQIDRKGDELAIYSRSSSGDEAADWRLHATGRLSEAAPRRAGESVPLAAVRQRCRPVDDVAGLYRQFDGRGLQYGPFFQAVRRLWVGSGEVLAEVAAHPGLTLDAEHDRLHPTLLDASFQALMAALPAGISGTYVPVRIDRVSLSAPAPSRLWSHGRIVRQTRKAVEADITLCDDSGCTVAQIRGLRCEPLPDDVEADPAGRLRACWYAYRWELVAPEPAGASVPADPGFWLIFSDRGGVGDSLAKELTDRGANCIGVRAGDGFFQPAPDDIRLNPEGARDLARLLTADGGERLRGIAYLWGLDAGGDEDDPTGEQACLPLLSLVQEVTRADSPDRPQLALVTRLAHDVTGTDRPVAGAQASLWGLGRVIMSEHPELRCTLADLGAANGTMNLAALADALLQDEQHEEIAFRGEQRYVHRLQRALLDEDGEEAPVTVPATVPFALEIGKPGTLDGLHFRETERRAPGAGEVELRIDAISLNFKDILKLLGMLSETVTDDTFFGTAIGMEAAATVVGVGPGVDALGIGDRIIVSAGGGCLQSYITVPLDRLFFARTPEGVDHAQLSGLPVAFITAVYGLRDVARLQPGERILLHSATGGVGLAAIQVARRLGAEIFATAGSPEKREYLRSLGIRHVMDSRSLDFADQILDLTEGRGVDVVLNFLPGEALEKSLKVLAPFGRFVEIGKRDIAEDNGLPLGPFNRNLSFTAIDVDRLLEARPDDARRLLKDIWRDVEAGDYRPLPCRVFPIAELADACRLMMQARHIGKVIVTLADEEVPILPLRREAPLFRPDATYLITGGLGGFGLQVAKWMVEEGARHLALVGRRGAATAEAEKAVQALEEMGARVLVAAADVADAAQMTALLGRIASIMPPLRGILHAAMVLDDVLIAQLDRERLARVMAPKARGAWLLHRLTRDVPLDLFVLFSSVSALVGNPGQGSYVAANAFLDALAHHRRAQGLPAVSINWGVLADVGVAARDAAVSQHLERVGMKALPPRLAVEALGRVLRHQPVQVGVMDLDWQKWGQANPAVRQSSRFGHLISESGAAGSAADALRQDLLAAAPEDRDAVMTALVADEIGKVLRIPAGKLEVHEPLSRVGIDSLTAVELQVALQSQFQIEVSSLELMKGISVAQLASTILTKLNIASSESAGQPDDCLAG